MLRGNCGMSDFPEIQFQIQPTKDVMSRINDERLQLLNNYVDSHIPKPAVTTKKKNQKTITDRIERYENKSQNRIKRRTRNTSIVSSNSNVALGYGREKKKKKNYKYNSEILEWSTQ